MNNNPGFLLFLIAFNWIFTISCLANSSVAPYKLLATNSADTVGPAPGSNKGYLKAKKLQPSNNNSRPTPASGGEPRFLSWGMPIPVNDIVEYAQTLIGTPYHYGSSDPSIGFDCSGFITYIFNHFGLKVPRSSVDFTNRGTEVPLAQAKKGDLILFTGTDSTLRRVGHMGIVLENSKSLRFIHSSSGKAHAVIISILNNYYLGRFIKVIAVDKGL